MIELILLVLFIIIALLFLRFEHMNRKVKWVLIILIVFMIYFSVTGFLNTSDPDFQSPKGIANTAYAYVGWVGNAIKNLWSSKDEIGEIVGDAIKFNNTGS